MSLTLATDVRLKHAVTISAIGVNLDAFLEALSKKGVALKCDKECADLKLHLNLKERSLAEVMVALADLVPGKWERKDAEDSYFLHMSERAVRRRKNWWDTYLEARRKALQLVPGEILKSMRAAPPSEERARILMGNDPEFINPIIQQKFFNLLPQDLQQHLAQRMAGGVEDSLSAATNSWDDERAVYVPLSDIPAAARPIQEDRPGRIPTDTVVRFTFGSFNLIAVLLGPDGKIVYHTLTADLPNFQSIGIGLDQEYLVEWKHKGLLERAPVEWSRLADYQESTFWNNRLSELSFRPRQNPLWRPDLLNYLAQQTGMEFISDYYARPGVMMTPAQKATPLPQPLEQELNTQAALLDMSWKRKGTLYLFRNNRWYRDDALEVPTALARDWLKKFSPAHAGPTPPAPSQQEDSAKSLQKQLDRRAEIIGKLNRWQILRGLRWLARENLDQKTTPQWTTPFGDFPFYQDSITVMREYHLIQFYRSLEPEERADLCSGRLPYSSLTQTRKQEALRLAPLIQQALAQNPNRTLLLALGRKGTLNPKLGLVFSVP
jgi:hypothetical protein